MKDICPHGSKLPKGLVCDKGYLAIRIATDNGLYHRGCGKHTLAMEKLSILALNKMREQLFLGTFGIVHKLKRIKFKEAWAIYHTRHFVEWHDPKTNAPRTPKSVSSNAYVANAIGPTFNDLWLDGIKLQHLQEYRQERIDDGISPATLNREMASMSSLFKCFERWIAGNEIEPVAMPAKNPCTLLPDLAEEGRDREISIPELKKLKEACIETNDLVMWDIIRLGFLTSLRYSDLQLLETAKVISGKIMLTQGKTGKKIFLPGELKPDWNGAFVNFDRRFDNVKLVAGVADIQFRDIRKTSLRMMQDKFSDEQIANKAGHGDVKTTQIFYLKNLQAEKMRPLIAETNRLLEAL